MWIQSAHGRIPEAGKRLPARSAQGNMTLSILDHNLGFATFPRRIGFVCLTLFFLVFGTSAAADSAPPAPKNSETITVVLDDNYPPYIFRDSSGALQGILRDTWLLWEHRTGIRVDLQAMDWAKAQQVILSGKGDVIDTIFFTEARSRLYEYSKPYATLRVPIFFHKSISGIATPESVKGFTVGVKEGDACIDFLQAKGITELKPYPNYETLIRAAGQNQVRVFCVDEPPAFHFLYKLGLEKEFRYSPPLYVGQFHRAVLKGNVALLNKVEAGFARISAEERQAIEDKWLGKSAKNEALQLWARNAGLFLLAVLGIALLLALWNYSLHLRVFGKTRELSEALASLRQSKQETEEINNQLTATLEAIPDLLFELDLHGRYLDCRATRNDLLVAPPGKLLGNTVFDVMPANAAGLVMATLREASEMGSSHGTLVRLAVPAGERWFELSVARKPTPTGQEQRFILISRDVSERVQAQDEIEWLAFYDALTQLPNRHQLTDRLRQALAASHRRNRHGALLFIDLDDFKTLNETKGHAAGDLFLKEVADRLRASMRADDTIARLGGDEFVVMLEDLSANSEEAAAQAEAVGEKIQQIINLPCQIDAYSHQGTASIGISLFSGQAQSEEELLKRADSAVYRAKTAGRNTVRFFDPEIQANLEARTSLEAELRRALSSQQLCLYYQPQISQEEGVFGAEALIRWPHPERGMISPAQFIPLAEDTGLIVPIGQWVLETACAQLKRWEQDPLTRNLQVSVNVSARQFRQADFVDSVRSILASSGANPARLKIELTESLVLDNVATSIEKMRELRSSGVGFSMDDFGTGYSSLSYLKRLPLDQLKIDQSFVRDIAISAGDAVIVQTIIGMAHNLGLSVIAEGVENEAQRDFLVRNGCSAFQGFLYSPAVPAADFEALLQKLSQQPGA